MTPLPLQHKFTTGQQTYSGDLHLAASNFLVGAGKLEELLPSKGVQLHCPHTFSTAPRLVRASNTCERTWGAYCVFSIQLRNNFDDTGSQGFVFTERTGTSHLDKVH